jgi:hypothetical protein
MKTIAIVLLFIVGFVCGMCFENARWELDTEDWIDPAMIESVNNPFGAPTAEQEQVLGKINWELAGNSN